MTRFAWVVLAILAVVAIPAAARADTITLTDWTSGNFAANAAGGGGAFLATTTGELLGNSAFMTFCIEYNEHFSYGGTYNFELSDSAVAGGVSGGVGGADLVSYETMWLYYQALSGGYSSWWAVNENLGATFQEAIWFLEGERNASQISSAGYLMAQYAIAHQNWGDLYAQGHRVYAMNLTTTSGSPAQDQLAYIAPVPEHGSLLLFVTGLAGVGGLRRTWRTRRG